jgi:hypothetical protein
MDACVVNINCDVQVVYNADMQSIEFRVLLADGTGDHVLATLPATPPPGNNPE